MPVALYARVSSDRQDVDLSVAAQLRALREHADKNGYVVVREFVDEAESGRVADRPQFQEMLDEAKKTQAPFREILVWKFSRFTRKREHAVAFKSMLRRRGIRVVSITEQADDTAAGRLLEGIIETIDEFYSENLAQDVTRGMREAASRGFWMSSEAPLGYNRVMVQDGPKKRPKLEPDTDSSHVVRRMFDLSEAGKSTLDIARILNDEGITSPRGKSWGKTSVHAILINETYTGTLTWGVNAKNGADPRAGGERLPRHHLHGPVQSRQQAATVPSAQDRQPPQGGKPLPPQWAGQVQDLQAGAHRAGLEVRAVHLLRLPDPHEAGEGILRRPEAQRPALRGAGRGQDSCQHLHRGQHPRPGEGGGRGDRQHGR